MRRAPTPPPTLPAIRAVLFFLEGEEVDEEVGYDVDEVDVVSADVGETTEGSTQVGVPLLESQIYEAFGQHALLQQETPPGQQDSPQPTAPSTQHVLSPEQNVPFGQHVSDGSWQHTG